MSALDATEPRKFRQEAEALLGRFFREHWSALGKVDTQGLMAKREHAFLAGSQRVRIRLARQYYNRRRIEKFATACDADVARYCSPWLSNLLSSAGHFSLTKRELRKEIRALVSAEYVAIVTHFPNPLEHSTDDPPLVCPIPDQSVVYGDLYEITASGFSMGGRLLLCKSVSTPFGEGERRSAKRAMFREFMENAKEDDDDRSWLISFPAFADRRMIMMQVSPRHPQELRRHLEDLL